MLLMHFATIQWLCKLTHSIWVSKVSKHGGGVICCCIVVVCFLLFRFFLSEFHAFYVAHDGRFGSLSSSFTIDPNMEKWVSEPSVCLPH